MTQNSIVRSRTSAIAKLFGKAFYNYFIDNTCLGDVMRKIKHQMVNRDSAGSTGMGRKVREIKGSGYLPFA